MKVIVARYPEIFPPHHMDLALYRKLQVIVNPQFDADGSHLNDLPVKICLKGKEIQFLLMSKNSPRRCFLL